MVLFIGLTVVLYLLCVFINPYYAANLYYDHKVEVPVLVYSLLGFFGTIMITILYLMNIEPDNHSYDRFSKTYKRYLRKLNE